VRPRSYEDARIVDTGVEAVLPRMSVVVLRVD
jgi:hypothetical protein